jgi:predicted enzyme related to lactoylglutathione lyase
MPQPLNVPQFFSLQQIDPKQMDESYGRFAWIYDVDGNKIELWQPSAKP